MSWLLGGLCVKIFPCFKQCVTCATDCKWMFMDGLFFKRFLHRIGCCRTVYKVMQLRAELHTVLVVSWFFKIFCSIEDMRFMLLQCATAIGQFKWWFIVLFSQPPSAPLSCHKMRQAWDKDPHEPPQPGELMRIWASWRWNGLALCSCVMIMCERSVVQSILLDIFIVLVLILLYFL